MTPDEVINYATRNQIFLEGYKVEQQESYLDDVVKALVLLYLAKINGLNVTSIADLTERQLNRTIGLINANQDKIFKSSNKKLSKSISDLGEVEAEVATKNLIRLDPGSIKVTPPKAKAIEKEINSPLSTGDTVVILLSSLAQSHKVGTAKILRAAWVNGTSTANVIREYTGDRKANYHNGYMQKTVRQIKQTVNTVVQHAAHAAIYASYLAAPDIVRGYKWVAILDSRTSPFCRFTDGKVFEFGKGPIPPAHFGCRSTIAPVLTSKFDNLGADATRSSSSGRVSAKMTYYQWLKTQPAGFQDEVLGKARGQGFRSGELSVEKFTQLQLDKTFKQRTLDELRQLAPKAFKPTE